MNGETKLVTDKFNELMKKEWPAPAAVKKLEATMDTQEKTLKSLKPQPELQKSKKIEDPPSHFQSTRDPSWAQEYVKIETGLGELKKDYALMQVSSDEALEELRKEIMGMNKQAFGMQTVITKQQEEIKDLQTMKPRELAKIRVQSAPPGKDKDTAATQNSKPIPAAAQVHEPVAAAPTAGEDIPTMAIDSNYVYQGKCEDDDSQT